MLWVKRKKRRIPDENKQREENYIARTRVSSIQGQGNFFLSQLNSFFVEGKNKKNQIFTSSFFCRVMADGYWNRRQPTPPMMSSGGMLKRPRTDYGTLLSLSFDIPCKFLCSILF